MTDEDDEPDMLDLDDEAVVGYFAIYNDGRTNVVMNQTYAGDIAFAMHGDKSLASREFMFLAAIQYRVMHEPKFVDAMIEWLDQHMLEAGMVPAAVNKAGMN